MRATRIILQVSLCAVPLLFGVALAETFKTEADALHGIDEWNKKFQAKSQDLLLPLSNALAVIEPWTEKVEVKADTARKFETDLTKLLGIMQLLHKKDNAIKVAGKEGPFSKDEDDIQELLEECKQNNWTHAVAEAEEAQQGVWKVDKKLRKKLEGPLANHASDIMDAKSRTELSKAKLLHVEQEVHVKPWDVDVNLYAIIIGWLYVKLPFEVDIELQTLLYDQRLAKTTNLEWLDWLDSELKVWATGDTLKKASDIDHITDAVVSRALKWHIASEVLPKFAHSLVQAGLEQEDERLEKNANLLINWTPELENSMIRWAKGGAGDATKFFPHGKNGFPLQTLESALPPKKAKAEASHLIPELLKIEIRPSGQITHGGAGRRFQHTTGQLMQRNKAQ